MQLYKLIEKQNELEIMIVINNHNQEIPDCTNSHNHHNSDCNQEISDCINNHNSDCNQEIPGCITTTTAALQPGNTRLNQN